MLQIRIVSDSGGSASCQSASGALIRLLTGSVANAFLYTTRAPVQFPGFNETVAATRADDRLDHIRAIDQYQLSEKNMSIKLSK